MSFWEYLAVLALCGPGITFIIAYGNIFAPLRKFISESEKSYAPKLAELIQCSLCLGFWVGVAVFFMCGAPHFIPASGHWIIDVPLGAFFSGCACSHLSLLMSANT